MTEVIFRNQAHALAGAPGLKLHYYAASALIFNIHLLMI